MKSESVLIIIVMILGLIAITSNDVKKDLTTMDYEIAQKNNLIRIETFGDSMIPTIHEGDILWGVEVNETTKLEIGDIVAYKNPLSPIGQSAHRIFKIENNKYYLIGDNPNKKRIDVVNREDILYKIIGISYSKTEGG